MSLMLCAGVLSAAQQASCPARCERSVFSAKSGPISTFRLMLSSPSARPKPSEFPNYDLVSVDMSRQDKSQEAEFLLSKDGKTLIRFTKIDLTKDPTRKP
jgi:hypothetical protein